MERKLYLREIVARFEHFLAVTWNLGEECSLSTDEIAAMARHLRQLDPYGHLVVGHTFPDQQDAVYRPLLGRADVVTGVSLQNGWSAAHRQTWTWIVESERSGHLWVVANDEQNPADLGVPPDEGWKGFDGLARGERGRPYTRHDIRKRCLWGTLMAGGEGVEYYFGYRLPENDLNCEDFRSREGAWRDAALARAFFRDHKVPFWEMRNADERVGNHRRGDGAYCLSKPGLAHVVYLPTGGTVRLDLSDDPTEYDAGWYDPRAGGPLRPVAPARVRGGGVVEIGPPPADPSEDWAFLLRRTGG